jgi:hypothetical protein
MFGRFPWWFGIVVLIRGQVRDVEVLVLRFLDRGYIYYRFLRIETFNSTMIKKISID